MPTRPTEGTRGVRNGGPSDVNKKKNDLRRVYGMSKPLEPLFDKEHNPTWRKRFREWEAKVRALAQESGGRWTPYNEWTDENQGLGRFRAVCLDQKKNFETMVEDTKDLKQIWDATPTAEALLNRLPDVEPSKTRRYEERQVDVPAASENRRTRKKEHRAGRLREASPSRLASLSSRSSAGSSEAESASAPARHNPRQRKAVLTDLSSVCRPLFRVNAAIKEPLKKDKDVQGICGLEYSAWTRGVVSQMKQPPEGASWLSYDTWDPTMRSRFSAVCRDQGNELKWLWDRNYSLAAICGRLPPPAEFLRRMSVPQSAQAYSESNAGRQRAAVLGLPSYLYAPNC